MTDRETMVRFVTMKRNRRKRTEARLRAHGIETWVPVKDRMDVLKELFKEELAVVNA